MTASVPAFSGTKTRIFQERRRSTTKKFTKGDPLLEKPAQKRIGYSKPYYYYLFVNPPFVLQKGWAEKGIIEWPESTIMA